MADSKHIYNPEFVTSLFDEMSKTYGLVNSISSFGFCYFWRVACAGLLNPCKGDIVVDLMSGMSELSIVLNERSNNQAHFVSLDASSEMCKLARKSVSRKQLDNFEVVEGDALDLNFANDSIDGIGSTFGLKTFDEQQIHRLAAEIYRVIKPGGEIAFLEISVPRFSLLSIPYMFYLNHVIPIIGRLLMGNADNYRLLGVYTRQFRNCDRSIEIFRSAGFDIEPKSFFFGCATGFRGVKPLL